MAKRGKNEKAWAEAKKLCRLSARHIQMAKQLGMNPRNLPGLRPSRSQQWKAPVPQFIEECYRKRFGDAKSPKAASTAFEDDELGWDFELETARPQKSPLPHSWAPPDSTVVLMDLICFLSNLTDDLESVFIRREVTDETREWVVQTLHSVADEVEAGTPIAPFPVLWGHDDDIPF
ncbi:MAG: hypothetical protein HY791_40380 [Deltaproteobacteria bacterium]|nr:hypothetical protein [Deltaproteobacteria bacterium]